MGALYLDTSAVLRAILEVGTTPEIEDRISGADVLITSRLSLVESARALVRAKVLGRLSERENVHVERALDEVWARCHVWEITRAICERAASIAPRTSLRTLDAIQLATFVEARRRLGEVELLTVDERLSAALGAH